MFLSSTLLKRALPPLLVPPIIAAYTMAAMGGSQRMKTSMTTSM
jgi:hypothetical protein